ncbi:MAG: hypothetical protein ISP90_06300 [Nevskia sp.]|nr:hypothetical protein [Nevskia sp.]
MNPNRNKRRRDGSARTLIATVVASLAATVAGLPAYREYALQTHTRLAAGVLEDAYRRWQERQGADPFGRLLSLETLGYPASTVYLSWDGTLHENEAGGSVYRLSLRLPAGTEPESCGLSPGTAKAGFVLVAQPLASQAAGTRCGTLCLSSTGERAVTGTGEAASCWK